MAILISLLAIYSLLGTAQGALVGQGPKKGIQEASYIDDIIPIANHAERGSSRPMEYQRISRPVL